MSGSSSAMPSGRKSAIAGREWGLRSARSHASNNTRCLIDFTTEGLALSNSIFGLAEFNQIAGGNPSGRAVEKVAINHGAKFRGRQGVISTHQIPDFEPTVLADGLQRCEHVRDVARFRERQQHSLIRDDSSIDIVDGGDGIDGEAAVQAFTVDRHYDRSEPDPEIIVEIATSARIAVGDRHACAVAVDDQTRRLPAPIYR